MSVGMSLSRTLKSTLFRLLSHHLYAVAWTLSREVRMESSFDWSPTKSSTAFQAAALMSAGIRSVASYFAILVPTRICALSFDRASGYASSGGCLLGEILPPYTLLSLGPSTVPQVVNADLISGEVHF